MDGDHLNISTPYNVVLQYNKDLLYMYFIFRSHITEYKRFMTYLKGRRHFMNDVTIFMTSRDEPGVSIGYVA